MDTAPSLIGLITGGLTMAGILVMLGRVLARFDDLARRFDELLDAKSGIVPELRKRTHDLASRDQSTDASVAFLRQELEHHKRDTATHFARVAADLDVAAQLRRIEDKLERRSNA